jgi:hypothetical protein
VLSLEWVRPRANAAARAIRFGISKGITRMAQITVFPLAGWNLATLPQQWVLLDLALLPSEDALRTGERRSLPVGMTADAAIELAEALKRAAAAARMGQAPTTTRS